MFSAPPRWCFASARSPTYFLKIFRREENSTPFYVFVSVYWRLKRAKLPALVFPALAGERDESYNLAYNLAGYCLPWIYVDTGGALRVQAFYGEHLLPFLLPALLLGRTYVGWGLRLYLQDQRGEEC